ncbi:MAG TPA: VOC family protein [Candidatus Saccharimonadales bacterium]|nr:VOC family protein [Candidatus Saccharimonadales bacterium]
MLSDMSIMPTVAVKDIEKAKEFYEGKLGLRGESDPGGVRYRCGKTHLYVYESPRYAGSNKATYAGWSVPDLPGTVEELKSKGVEFEKYDMPNVTHEGDIHVMEDTFRAAWFKDPDGNIFALDESE